MTVIYYVSPAFDVEKRPLEWNTPMPLVDLVGAQIADSRQRSGSYI